MAEPDVAAAPPTRAARAHSDPGAPAVTVAMAATPDRAVMSVNSEAERERRMAAIRQKVQEKKNEQSGLVKKPGVESPPPSSSAAPSPAPSPAPVARTRVAPPRLPLLTHSQEQVAPMAEPAADTSSPARVGRHSDSESASSSSALSSATRVVSPASQQRQQHRRTGSSTPPKGSPFVAPRAQVPTLGEEEPTMASPRTKSLSARSIPRLQRSKSGVDVAEGLAEVLLFAVLFAVCAALTRGRRARRWWSGCGCARTRARPACSQRW